MQSSMELFLKFPPLASWKPIVMDIVAELSHNYPVGLGPWKQP